MEKRVLRKGVLRKVCEPKGEELRRKQTKCLLKDSILLLLFTNSIKMIKSRGVK